MKFMGGAWKDAKRSTIVCGARTIRDLAAMVPMVGQTSYRSGGSGGSRTLGIVYMTHRDGVVDNNDQNVGGGPEP